MARHVTYRQRDLAAALRAVAATNAKARSVEIDRDGKIVIVLGEPEDEPEVSPWKKHLNESATDESS